MPLKKKLVDFSGVFHFHSDMVWWIHTGKEREMMASLRFDCRRRKRKNRVEEAYAYGKMAVQ